MYVVLDELCPGDIILSSGQSQMSRWIRFATFGKFSHAALVIDPLIWVESSKEGINYTFRDYTICAVNGKVRCLAKMPTGECYLVLRPKAAAGHSRADLQRNLVVAAHRQIGFDYPRFEHFLGLIRGDIGKLPTIKRLAIALDKRPRFWVYGDFCSALVVRCLQDAGIPIFEGRAPQAVSPAALGRKRADLVRVNAILKDVDGDGTILQGPIAEGATCSLNMEIGGLKLLANAVYNTAKTNQIGSGTRMAISLATVSILRTLRNATQFGRPMQDALMEYFQASQQLRIPIPDRVTCDLVAALSFSECKWIALRAADACVAGCAQPNSRGVPCQSGRYMGCAIFSAALAACRRNRGDAAQSHAVL